MSTPNSIDQQAKIPVDEDVELVVFPPSRTFYEVLTQELGGARAGGWPALLGGGRPPLAETVLRHQLFRRGEALALMPMRFVR